MNEDKLASAKKGLFYLWSILCKPHVNHKAKIQTRDINIQKGGGVVSKSPLKTTNLQNQTETAEKRNNGATE